MEALGILLFSVSLNIDALGIGISYGVRSIRISFAARAIISIISIFVAGLTLALSKAFLDKIPEEATKVLGIIILFAMGICIIYKSKPNKKVKESNLDRTVKILSKPESGDFDSSLTIEPIEAFYIGLALNLDTIGAIFVAYAVGVKSFYLPFCIAGCQFLFIWAGLHLGQRLNRIYSNNTFWSFLSGIILIVIAVLRLM